MSQRKRDTSDVCNVTQTVQGISPPLRDTGLRLSKAE